MNYRVVATIFLGLAAAVGWLELPEDKTAEKATKMVVTAGTVAL
jgi:hypothetical protein